MKGRKVKTGIRVKSERSGREGERQGVVLRERHREEGKKMEDR